MDGKIQNILSEVSSMSSHEKAVLVRCLLLSLDHKTDEGVDDTWLEIAEQRFKQLQSGEVKPISWTEIKQKMNER